MKRIAVPALVAAVAIVAAIWWLALTRFIPTGENAPPQASTRGTPASRATGSEVIALPEQPRVVALPTPSPAVLATQLTRDQIRDALDLRALYERMKDMPDPTGERSYRLAEAIFHCSAFVDSSAEDLGRRLALTKAALESPRRQELLNFMVERCKGFSGNPAALREITQALHRRAEAAGYPAEIARSLRFEAGSRDPDRADQTATLLLANPDPDVVHELAQFLNLRNQRSPLHRGEDAATRSIAWRLLECEYGGDCGPRSQPVVMTCIVMGACDLVRVEEAVLAQGTQAVVNNAMVMRDRLARQIAARDWAGVGFTERFKAP
ncbi:MAG: hypothetical protein H7Y14_11300 [Burkholderiales bacterium]|nr:hypothetical protein [Burkholderiales bacterium]